MAPITDLILQSLAPGVALTSVIFYVTGLQNRFLYIASRARDLNKEARDLGRADAEAHRERLGSLSAQVEALLQRSVVIRRTILISYGAFFCFILTIMQLLVAGAAPGLLPVTVLPAFTFGLGFLALAIATVHSSAEMLLSMRTLHEDVRSSFPPGFGPAMPTEVFGPPQPPVAAPPAGPAASEPAR